ncbi:MAG: ABC transporter ATP-binding protein [Saccharofermentanales bacterium]
MKMIFRKYIPLMVLALSVGLLAALANGFMSYKMMDVVDYALAGQRDKMMDAGIETIILAFFLLGFSTLLSFAKGYYRKTVNVALKKAYLQGVFKKNINEFNKESHARYVSGITNDLSTLDINYIDAIFEITSSVISFLVIVVIIANVNPVVLLSILVMAGAVALISTTMSKPLKKKMTERSLLFEKYTGYLSEVLNAFRIIKANNLTDRVKKNFHEKGEKLQNKSYDIDKLSTYIYAIQNATINFLVIGVMVLSVYLTIRGTMTFGGIILIFSNLNLLLGPFARAGELFPKIISSKVLFTSLDDSLKNAYDYPETVEFKGLSREIVFDDVSFAYGENQVFDHVSIRFEKGKKYLLIGPSGGGKSTFLKLLRKYHYPTSGDVLVDGVSLRDVTKESYFKDIANVDQNIFIFDDTLRNNLTLYRDATEEQVSEAVRKAGLESFVKGLPQGLGTVLKDNGRNISGGEKSRIAIARALLDDVDLMLLDEAFANLDYKTASEIEKTILQAENLTVINVSHVLIHENMDSYDKLYYVDQKTIK